MNTTELYAAFRSEVVDEEEPYLWADTDVFRYMNEAQMMLCRMAQGVSDTTSDVAKVSITAGEETSPLDPRVLKVRGAQLVSNGRPLRILNYEDLQYETVSDYGLSQISALPSRPGTVKAMIVGIEDNMVTWVDIPEADDEVKLIIYRLPLETLTDFDQELEVDARHHNALLWWMKALAYQKQDAETFDRGRSKENEDRFFAYCEKVYHEQRRAKHKARQVAYGGL